MAFCYYRIIIFLLHYFSIIITVALLLHYYCVIAELLLLASHSTSAFALTSSTHCSTFTFASSSSNLCPMHRHQYTVKTLLLVVCFRWFILPASLMHALLASSPPPPDARSPCIFTPGWHSGDAGVWSNGAVGVHSCGIMCCLEWRWPPWWGINY